MSWHLDEGVIEAYVDHGADPATAFSVEAHVLTCAKCRAAIASRFDDSRLAEAWRGLRLSIAGSPRTAQERALIAVGVREETARLLAVTPSLQLSWFAALAMTLALALTLAHLSVHGSAWFLIAAPILPLGATVLAYGPHADPAYEIAIAAPRSLFDLMMIRTTAVLVTSIFVVGTATVFLPDVDWRAAGWILPSLALSINMLVLSSRMSPVAVGAGFAVTWIGGVVMLGELAALESLWGPTMQAGFGGAAAIGALALFASRQRFETGRIV